MRKPTTAKTKSPTLRTLDALVVTTEAQFESAVIQNLGICGYTVFKTGKNRSGLAARLANAMMGFTKPGITQATVFQRINQILRQWSTNEAGLPDLIVRHPQWPKWDLLGIELKGKMTLVSEEQKIFHSEGVYPICRTMEEVLEVLMTRPYDTRLQKNLESVFGRRLMEP